MGLASCVILIIIAAVSFFLTMMSIPTQPNERTQRVITAITTVSLGIYLIHPAVIDFLVYQRWLKYVPLGFGFPLLNMNEVAMILGGGAIVYLLSGILAAACNLILGLLTKIYTKVAGRTTK